MNLVNAAKRWISSLDTPSNIERAKNWIKNFSKESIPKDVITITFARSSGPGGQNVNKVIINEPVNTKVDLRFNLNQADWIPEYARKKLAIQESNRINKKGEIIITSETTRSQAKNIEDCIDKLYEIIVKAAEIPKGPSEETLQRIEKLKKEEDQRRKSDKKFRSQKKSGRKYSDDS